MFKQRYFHNWCHLKLGFRNNRIGQKSSNQVFEELIFILLFAYTYTDRFVSKTISLGFVSKNFRWAIMRTTLTKDCWTTKLFFFIIITIIIIIRESYRAYTIVVLNNSGCAKRRRGNFFLFFYDLVMQDEIFACPRVLVLITGEFSLSTSSQWPFILLLS